MRGFKLILSGTIAVILLSGSFGTAQMILRRGRAGPGPGFIPLPYSVPDNSGNAWMIYQQGWFQHQGNTPLYGQAATLTIDGNELASTSNQATKDDSTGEVVFDGLSGGGITVTRRILVQAQERYIRYIDILKNPSDRPTTVELQINTNVNFGIQSFRMIADPKAKGRDLAAAVVLQQGQTVLEMYGGKGARNVPQIEVRQNNNDIHATAQVSIPAHGEVAFFHLHMVSTTPDAATQFVASVKEAKILAGLPFELRKSIFNVSSLQTAADREILRGELFDVIELRGGDQLKGTIAEKSFKLQTFYGDVELPADRVVALLSVGQFRPRQLLVTVDGEVFGGTLKKETIAIQLSSGQTTQVPLSQISRLGYRKRSGEPEEWTFDRPMVYLRSGERMLVAMPKSPIDVMTRYGLLKLEPRSLSAIVFQAPEQAVHEVQLTDGSRFAGLVSADHFDMQLVGTASQQSVSFPASLIQQFQFTKATDDEVDDDAPMLALANKDRFVGTLASQLKLDTNFDTLTINAAEVRALTHLPDAGLDVQATLWDQTTVSGQLHDPEIACQLKSGVSMKIPVAMLDRYSNPDPQPSQSMVDRIKAVVAQLNAPDWKQREDAQAQLVSMGPTVVGVLKELSPSQPAEAQQRIQVVIDQFESKPESTPPPVAGQ